MSARSTLRASLVITGGLAVGGLIGWLTATPVPAQLPVVAAGATWDVRPLRVAADLPFADLAALPVDRLLPLVDSLPAKGDALTADERAGLRVIMLTKGVEPVIRNNIANRLVDRVKPDPDLWRDFAASYADAGEDAVWRDYSVQFLSLSIASAGDKQAAAGKLLAIARDDRTTIGATALLHVVRLAGEGVIERPADLNVLISSRITAKDAPDPVRHTAFALVGEEKITDLLPLVRQELQKPAGDDAKRGALFALGKLGGAADIALVEPYAKDRNGAVVLAADAALKRLRNVSAPTPGDGPVDKKAGG